MEGFSIILPLLGLLLSSGTVGGEQTDREESVKYKEDLQRDGNAHPRGEAPHEEIPYSMRIKKILRDLIDSERVAELASSVVRTPGNSVGRDARNEEVRPAPEHSAPAEEQGEHGDAHRGGEGVQEEHGIASSQSQQEVNCLFYVTLS